MFCSLSFDTHTTYTKLLGLQNNVSNDPSTHSAEPLGATKLRGNFVANFFTTLFFRLSFRVMYDRC